MRRLLEMLRRLAGSVRPSRTDADLAEELRLHAELAAEDERRRGGAAADATRAARLRTGTASQAMDRLRDQRGLPWVGAIAADVVYGWRQILRHRTASASAILSLGLALGATLAALRLVDALLLRPLPVADPSRLFVLTHAFPGAPDREDRDDFDYPSYRTYATLAGDRAEVMIVGMAVRRPILVDGDPEPAMQQFLSGNVFSTLGLQPALGRLLLRTDDVVPNGHPVAVISYDYWRRRFGADPSVIGRHFRIGARAIEIVGVAPRGFTGTEPGAITDFFLPSMMNADALDKSGWTWFRIWIRPKPGIAAEAILAELQARFHADHLARVKEFAPDTPRPRIDAFLNEALVLRPASAGVSGLQNSFRRPLWILAALAVLLLLIASANVANLMLARAMSRRIEMALRVSIGASRGRLVQLMLIESVLVGLLASLVGALFAVWAAPFVVSMLAPAERPVRLILTLDWRSVMLGAMLTMVVTMLFGLAPAFRASAVAPFDALRDMRGRRGQRRLTYALIGAQMALCVFLLFGASLFVGTLQRLQRTPLGFTTTNLFHISAETRGSKTRPAEMWAQLAATLRDHPRVAAAAVVSWAPLTGNRWRSSVTVAGKAPEPDAPNWVSVGPGYFDTMRERLIDGRDFRPGDVGPRRDDSGQLVTGTAIVNETFARVYFDGRSPVGQRVVVNSSGAPVEIVGLVADAVYTDVKEPKHPGVFIPLEARYAGTILVRTSDDGADLRALLRQEIPRAWPEMVVRDVVAFDTLVSQQIIRERLLAALSMFLASLALLLAVMGMYGVLNYAVTRERREIGLRMALGARPGQVLRLVTTRLIVVVALGAFLGLGGGLMIGRAVRTLLFEMEPTDPVAIGVPILALAVAAAIAALPPALRAVRIDPAKTIRTEG